MTAAVDFAPTEKVYQMNSDVFEMQATILGVTEVQKKKNDDGGDLVPALVLDKTIFHAQGGGQPSDVGLIVSEDGEMRFEVSFVKNENSVLYHTGHFVADGEHNFCVGTEVTLQIDREKRELHSRIHSAGHALDCALASLAKAGNKTAAELVPTKGYHFPGR